MRTTYVMKSLGQWEQGMVAAGDRVALPFLSFLLLRFFWFRRLSFHAWQLHTSYLCPFQAIWGDTERFQGDLQYVFEAIFLASLGALALRQVAVEQFLREAVIFYADRTGPVKLCLHQDGVDARNRRRS